MENGENEQCFDLGIDLVDNNVREWGNDPYPGPRHVAKPANSRVLRKPFERYAASGEINTHVDDPSAVIERVSEAFAGAGQDRLDGLTVDKGSWWFNLRPSNTEPLLRLNLEAATRDECDAHVAEVLALITGS